MKIKKSWIAFPLVALSLFSCNAPNQSISSTQEEIPYHPYYIDYYEYLRTQTQYNASIGVYERNGTYYCMPVEASEGCLFCMNVECFQESFPCPLPIMKDIIAYCDATYHLDLKKRIWVYLVGYPFVPLTEDDYFENLYDDPLLRFAFITALGLESYPPNGLPGTEYIPY